MLVECQECGAPLDVKPGTRTTKCNYCGSTNQSGTMRTIAAVTPAGWTPPQVWSPKAGAKISGALVYKAGTAIAGFTLIMFLLPIVLMCVIFMFVGGVLFFTLPSAVQQGSGPGIMRREWSGATPFACGGNEELTFSGVAANLPGQTAISAGGNCHITCVDCNLTASQGVVAGGNAQVTLRGGSVTGTFSALQSLGNAHITVEATRISGATTMTRPGGISGVP